MASVAEHPIDLLRRLRFRVTVNTDNRLMSGVSLSSEFAALDEAFGLGLGEMEWLTINALKSAFVPFDERLTLINEIVKPGYAHGSEQLVKSERTPLGRALATRTSRRLRAHGGATPPSDCPRGLRIPVRAPGPSRPCSSRIPTSRSRARTLE